MKDLGLRPAAVMAEQTSGENPGPAGSFWQTKPGWCQPWTIVATGTAVSLASWVLLQRWWITAPVVGAVVVWWWLFLVLVPAGFSAAVSAPFGATDRAQDPDPAD